MTKLGQIEDYGKWYCFYKKEWKEGYDMLQYLCPGFHMKSCHYCTNIYCKGELDEKGRKSRTSWCNKFRRYNRPGRYYAGRPRNILNKIKDPVIKQMEKDLIAQRKNELKEKIDAKT